MKNIITEARRITETREVPVRVTWKCNICGKVINDKVRGAENGQLSPYYSCHIYSQIDYNEEHDLHYDACCDECLDKVFENYKEICRNHPSSRYLINAEQVYPSYTFED